MRRSEIQVGKTYTNGKTKRLVLSFQTIDAAYPDVVYLRDTPWNGVTEGVMWLPYFARWAKNEVKE
jgi:hypothetical protein